MFRNELRGLIPGVSVVTFTAAATGEDADAGGGGGANGDLESIVDDGSGVATVEAFQRYSKILSL
jgi:hypothetical protein